MVGVWWACRVSEVDERVEVQDFRGERGRLGSLIIGNRPSRLERKR